MLKLLNSNFKRFSSRYTPLPQPLYQPKPESITLDSPYIDQWVIDRQVVIGACESWYDEIDLGFPEKSVRQVMLGEFSIPPHRNHRFLLFIAVPLSPSLESSHMNHTMCAK